MILQMDDMLCSRYFALFMFTCPLEERVTENQYKFSLTDKLYSVLKCFFQDDPT